jgi:hypothetical protein
VLNELYGSPANLNVQTASNLDLAKVRNGKLIQYLSQEFACDVFELMRDNERVKEEIGFYNPEGWVNDDGNPVMNENRWKLWRMYAAGLPAAQSPNIEFRARLAPHRPAIRRRNVAGRFCFVSAK